MSQTESIGQVFIYLLRQCKQEAKSGTGSLVLHFFSYGATPGKGEMHAVQMRGNVLLLRSLEQRACAFSRSDRGGGGRLRSRKVLIEHEENALVKFPGNEVLVEVSKVPQPRPLIRWRLKRNAWARCIYADMCMSMAGSDGWSGGGLP